MSGKRPLHILSTTFRPLYQFLYPPLCLVCDAPLVDAGFKVCALCWRSVRPVSASDELYRRRVLRLEEKGFISGLISAYHFERDGTLQSLVHLLKYSGMTNVGNELGRRLGWIAQDQLLRLPVEGIVPVPLHSAKERERGYNQSTFLAEGLSDATGLPIFSGLLVRHKYTTSQTLLTLEERKANVGDAFSVRPASVGIVRGRLFVVLDDVLTTGATIGACAEALIGSGASGVLACTVALAE